MKRRVRRLGAGLVVGAWLCAAAGCGTLERMIPLTGDLTEEEVAYCHTLSTDWDLTLRVGGREYEGLDGDFRMDCYPPIYFGARGIVTGGGEIAGVRFSIAPLLPFVYASWGRGSAFDSEGRLLRTVRHVGFSPLVNYGDLWVDGERQAKYYTVLRLFGWGHTPSGWFARVVVPFGPGREDSDLLDAVLNARN